MSFYRSSTIEKYTLYLPRQSAWQIMNRLGQQDVIHIIPSKQHDIHRPFNQQIKRFEDSLQKIFKLQQILMQKKLMQTLLPHFSKENSTQIFNIKSHQQNEVFEQTKINEICLSVDQLWTFYQLKNQQIELLDRKINLLRQNIAILIAGEKQYGDNFFNNSKNSSHEKLSFSAINKLNFKAGVINKSEQIRLKRMIFRVTKGNCLIKIASFSQYFSLIHKNEQNKMIFFVIYQANPDSYFDRKLTKLVSIFCDKKYEYPSQNSQNSSQKIIQLHKFELESKHLKDLSQKQLQQFLTQKLLSKANNSYALGNLDYSKIYLIKQKQLYCKLNDFEVFNNFYQAQVFISVEQILKVQRILKEIKYTSSKLPSAHLQISRYETKKYPSLFSLNSFTLPAQQIVQTYGIPRYKQVNPAFFTNITFPFLFGVMFGDIAHGIVLFIIGMLLIWKQKCVGYCPEINTLSPLHNYRYLITMMGFFATFCGFIYNDFLSISLNIFTSCYSFQSVNQGQQILRTSLDCVYSFGLDPVWSVAQNSLNFTNSLKMKISVIIGVLHMSLGVFLKADNDIYFKNYKQLIFVFLPQIIFLWALFGYMDFLIIFKWLLHWDIQDTALAPSIISQIIALPLAFGSTQGKPLWNQQSQQVFQSFLMIISAIAIPLMLIPVPLMRILKQKKIKISSPAKWFKRKSSRSLISDDIRSRLIDEQFNNEDMSTLKSLESIEKQKDLRDEQIDLSDEQQQQSGQIIVHQIIQTIQYVLGSVSNTASYLRLWALSLAHSQLSQVFFQSTVQSSLVQGWLGILKNLIGFFLLSSITIAIMLVMDTMECFLHTLRLHWVEFQNKFFKGDGFSFNRFSFRNAINQQFQQRQY